MRQNLIMEGAGELSYEIREIVNKAHALEAAGRRIYWENIGDPIQKHAKLPEWMKDVLRELIDDDKSYGYSHSMGNRETRDFIVDRTNQRGGVQITRDDVLFFNGLGDAIATFYNQLDRSARVILPSPVYSTHSSGESAHPRGESLFYRLDPEDGWRPDIEDLYQKAKQHPNVVGLLIINPDNPTGLVYPLATLQKLVEIARELDLFILADEIYGNITYGETPFIPLCEVLEGVPGIAMKGVSKDFPWPGSRCGWLEFYNRSESPEFAKLCTALCNAKLVEVCATTLPQLAIPRVYGHPEYAEYRRRVNAEIGARSRFIIDTLGTIPELIVNEAEGAFYHTIIFRDGALTAEQRLEIDEPEIRSMAERWVDGVNLDYRFVYYLLAATGICVVPASSFGTPLNGFRITALEEDPEQMQDTVRRLAEAIRSYLASGARPAAA